MTISAEVIHRDLAAFCDPGTNIEIREDGRVIGVDMIRDGEPIRLQFDALAGSATMIGSVRERFSSIASLLASPNFANIASLLATQRVMLSKFDDSGYLPPEGRITQSSGEVSLLSLDRFDDATTSTKADQPTRVILLDGQAGVGKTALIQRLSARRVRNAVARRPPILHVSNRGSRLFGLNHLLAASLDTLRAKFTFDQAPSLIRHGLVVVAIDGFDELVDSEGYDDSWAALADFLREIGSGGTVILSGRDTFFDQQRFGLRLKEFSAAASLTNVRVTPTRVQSARDYLEAAGWTSEELSSEQGRAVLREGSFALRPFFLRTLKDAEPKDWERLLDGTSTRTFLVDQFLRREAGIVRTKIDIPLQVAISGLDSVFCEIALEMAASETSSVDIGFVELVLDSVFSDKMSPQELARIRYKAGSLGFLEEDEKRGNRKFPHTEISNYFLAKGLIQKHPEIVFRRIINRAILELDFFRIFSEVIEETAVEDVEDILSIVTRLLQDERGIGERYESNLAGLWLSALSAEHSELRRELRDRLAVDAAIYGMAAPAHLNAVMINRLDIRGTDLTNVVFENCNVSTLIVDNNTQFGHTYPVTEHLQIVQEGALDSRRGPEIHAWFENHAQSNEHLKSTGRAEKLLAKVLRTLQTRYQIRDNPDDPVGKLLGEDTWRSIEEILASEGRSVRDDRRGTSGRPDFFFRIIDPGRLADRNDPASIRIWQRVRQLDGPL